MSNHPRAQMNRTLTLIGVLCLLIAGACAFWRPDQRFQWIGFLVAACLLIQQDGLLQFMSKAAEMIRAWRGGAS